MPKSRRLRRTKRMTTKKMRGGNGVEESTRSVAAANESVAEIKHVVTKNELGTVEPRLTYTSKTPVEKANTFGEKAKALGEKAKNATLNAINQFKNWLGFGGRHHKTRKTRKSRKNRKH